MSTNRCESLDDFAGIDDSMSMELVTNHTWRCHYYVPTNRVGETLRFHFQGKELYTNEVAFTYHARTNTWYTDLTEGLPYVPYTSVARMSATSEATWKLDNVGTHLLIEFNDELNSFSVSHASYQNFNMWTDAINGFRGNARWNGATTSNIDEVVEGAAPAGVSDTKQAFDADMKDWDVSNYHNDYWREYFEGVLPYDTDYVYDEHLSVASTPNGWSGENGMFVRGQRGDLIDEDNVHWKSLAWSMDGNGKGSLSMKRKVVTGVGKVEFTARISQTPSFADFATYLDGASCKNYGISAQITMSRLYDADKKNTPLDISPCQPSVSLVGYYRESKGCYELRFTRTGDDKLTAGLYKWTQSAGSMVAELLTSNVLCTASSGATAGPGQTAFNSFNNLLVPSGSGIDDLNSNWTSCLFSLYTMDDGTVKLDGWLAPARDKNRIDQSASSLKHVIKWTDASPGVLTKGSYGVGSCDCQAAFGALVRHKFADDRYTGQDRNGVYLTVDGTVNSAEYQTPYLADDWDLMYDRWRQLGYKPGTTSWESSQWLNTGLSAVIPTNQTVKLYVSESTGNNKENWVDVPGCEVSVSSFSTNKVVFTPYTTANAIVQLRAGEGAASVTVGSIDITSWAAMDRGNFDYSYYKEWSYTAGTIETTLDVQGGNVEVEAAGTNGYVYIFTTAGKQVAVKTLADLTIDRLLLVGGGGAGGWTIGAGGGGGGMVEYDWTENPCVVKEGRSFFVTVGAGGDNYYKANNDGGNWKRGGSGGDSSINGLPSGWSTIAAKGGGGGGAWSNGTSGNAGGSGGGSAHGGDKNTPGVSVAGGSANQGAPGFGFSGGKAVGGVPGGGGGAGGPGEDAHVPSSGVTMSSYVATEPAKGGDGRMSDITGTPVYYGGGGGAGSGSGDTSPKITVGGAGGLGGGGSGLDGGAASRLNVDGTDGLGGGGGGGSHGGVNGTNAGGKGGRGTVIMRVRTAPKICTLQPARGAYNEEGKVAPMGLRSPFLENGMSMLSFSYANANSNCVIWLQVCTNLASFSYTTGKTEISPEDEVGDWQTRCVWLFSNAAKGITPQNQANLPQNVVRTNIIAKADELSGTLSYYQSLRSPVQGLMRIVIAPEVMRHAIDDQGPTCDIDYGKITITKIYCYDEPPLDLRSWWGWNMHTEGWNTPDKSYAYLTDSPNGLSCILNFSAVPADNTRPDANGIGLGEVNVAQYAENNPFVQCPPLLSGIGTVSFRARTFTNNQASSSWVTLYGSSEPDAYQCGDGWEQWMQPINDTYRPLAEFEITNNTFQTYTWKTSSDASNIQAVRLEVTAARHGRSPGSVGIPSWEKRADNQKPIQRVVLDEVTVSEPIIPRLVFRNVRPFRSKQLREMAMVAVSNVTHMSEQPITGESWGIQATVEPQQMSDELDVESLRVFASFHKGVDPWGYEKWQEREGVVELPRMGSNLVFRSHMSRPETIQAPLESYDTVQYMLYAEYKDISGNFHTNWLKSSEWPTPDWYYGMADLNQTYGAGLPERFSGYTIIDSISPKRAWINEVCYRSTEDDADADKKAQFIEFAVPQHADLTGWMLRVTGNNNTFSNSVLAVFGYNDATKVIKDGTLSGVDFTNNYVFTALRSPMTTDAEIRAKTDGIWENKLDAGAEIDYNGALKPGNPYGIALIRPSGVIEHQVITEGRNFWEDSDLDILKSAASGTNMLAKIMAKQPNSQWFFAGRDLAEGTLGVWRSHGEDGTCWTNRMISTPGELNKMADGRLQDIDPEWFLRPNGTNVWVYAYLDSPHIAQTIAGETTRSFQVIVLSKGQETNIVYHVDPWYAIGSCTTNDRPVPNAAGRGSVRDTPPHQWTLNLGKVEENITVHVGDQASPVVEDAGLSRDDPYYPAVMAWLRSLTDDDSTIYPAWFWPLSGDETRRQKLGIKDMYWLDINPTEPNWVLWAGMGGPGAGDPSSGSPTCTPVPVVDDSGFPQTNIIVTVTMMITNTETGVAYAPRKLQGLEPGSSSAAYGGGMNNWTSCTFKVTGALQKPGVKDNFYPLRWFVFGPDSFDSNFQARIEITDPFVDWSVGSNYGWPFYKNLYPIFYRWKLDGYGPGTASTEMLHSDSTYTH